MEPYITAKNIVLAPATREYIEKKLGKLNRQLNNITDFKVELAKEKTRSPQQRFVVQATLDSKGTLIRGEERGENLMTAIDKVETVMTRQIERYKGKLYDKGRGNSFARGTSSKEEPEAPTAQTKVVKVKHFTIKPMSVNEAIEQMELLGHDFFLFFNADNTKPNLVYHRKDGAYGLIEPE